MKSRFFLLLLVLSSSCSTSLRVDPKASSYHLGELPRDWSAREDQNSADHIFENKKSGVFLAVNSVCDRYPDSSLDSLMKQLYSPFGDLDIVKEQKFMLDGREAYMTEVRGTLDGVSVESKFVVFRKNNCIFDFTLDAKGKIKENDEKDFDRFVAGFKYNGSVAHKETAE